MVPLELNQYSKHSEPERIKAAFVAHRRLFFFFTCVFPFVKRLFSVKVFVFLVC